MAVYSSKQYDKMGSGTIAARRLGVRLVDGYLPARIEAPKPKFVGGARKRHVKTHLGSLVATTWPTRI